MIPITQQIANNFANKSISIVGYGVEGKSTVGFLLDCGINPKQITIHDGRETLQDQPAGVHYSLGSTYLETFGNSDIIIRSAGVSPHQAGLKQHQERITTQMKLFFEYYPNKSVIVTGTKGKSTIVSLLEKMFSKTNYSYELLGNIGIPVLSILTQDELPERVIIETSSYQLDGISFPEGREPDIGVLTSLYHEHHVDWHGGETQYFMSKIRAIQACKKKLVSSQLAESHSIVAYDLLENQHTQLFGADGDYTFSKGNFSIQGTAVATDTNMKLKGKHNRYNACAVLGVADLLGLETDYFVQAINSFAGLEHRLEDCGIHGGVYRIDDAISTTPESTIAALYTLGEQVETIFLGGKDGSYDFSTLAALIDSMSIKNIIFFPESGPKIEPLLQKTYTTLTTKSMDEAVQFAAQNTTYGKIALLSCASPSYGLWKNFIEKGQLFKKAVYKIQ